MNDVLRHLAALVACDTRNPPRDIGTGGIFDYLVSALSGFECEVIDHGAGAVSLLAVRGEPDLLCNVHVDTVPSSPAWTGDPLQLRMVDSHAVGLGACDIKGAAACLLAAAQRTRGDAALLFTSDEEANDARCIAAFLARKHTGFKRVLVAEPTRCEAVLAHRGISSVEIRFTGEAGHASAAGALEASALHQAVRWSTRALDAVSAASHERFGGLTGLRFNIGRIEGGIKANVVAPDAQLRFGFRPLPSQSIDVMHEHWKSLATPGAIASYTETFRGGALPAGDGAAAEDARLRARDMAEQMGLPVGNAVDFWTEAALFSAAGMDTCVFGPGDIAQAHTADEWVDTAQLQTAFDHYQRIFN